MAPVIILISLLLFVFYAVLIIYYAISWRRIPEYKLDEKLSIINYQLSIIIPARNEEKNIKACLDSICNQNFPNEMFEVLVVDDYSTDATATIVNNYPAKNVRLISLQQIIEGKTFNSYKKKAIEIAIAQSTGELIITTDADCIVPTNWLQTIASFYKENNAALIAMPVSYFSSIPGDRLWERLLGIFQSLDFMTLQGITGASVYKRIHSMCNGANLAYTKKVFYEVGGFTGIDTIASGDDMLLMHKIYQQHPDKVFFLKSKEVIVQTQPMQTIKDFFNQRIRWASKADQYDDKRIFAVLLLVYLFNASMLLLPLFLIFNFQFSIFNFWLFLLVAKTMVELFFLSPVATFFSKKHLLIYFPLAQPFHILYTIIAGWLGKFGSYQWKGRNVK